MHKGLKFISLFKVMRGFVTLSLAITLVWASQSGAVDIRELLYTHQDKDSIKEIAAILPDWIVSLSHHQLLIIGMLTFTLALIRFIEGVGIWFDASWAEYLAVTTGITTALFLAYSLQHEFQMKIAILLFLNLLIVGYLVFILNKKRTT